MLAVIFFFPRIFIKLVFLKVTYFILKFQNGKSMSFYWPSSRDYKMNASHFEADYVQAPLPAIRLYVSTNNTEKQFATSSLLQD